MKMISHGIIYGLAIIASNCVFLSATILTPLKVDPSSFHLYKTGLRNELDYILKRSTAVHQNVDESPDSKERRSQMGSSFIRFGRSRLEDNQENFEYPVNNYNDIGSEATASRIPRGRSDVIIRFGRAMRPKFDSIGEHSKTLKLLSTALEQLYLACPDVLASVVGSTDTDLTRLCTSLTVGFNENEKNN